MKTSHSRRRARAPRLLARKGVVLDTKLVRSLGLTWARRPTGEYCMTKVGWQQAEYEKAFATIDTFVEAAERIAPDDGADWACCTLDRINGLPSHRGDSVACDYFGATIGDGHSTWTGWYGNTSNPINRLARTLGLLLCAELVKEGFVPEGWHS